jgi:hypothetical protein
MAGTLEKNIGGPDFKPTVESTKSIDHKNKLSKQQAAMITSGGEGLAEGFVTGRGERAKEAADKVYNKTEGEAALELDPFVVEKAQNDKTYADAYNGGAGKDELEGLAVADEDLADRMEKFKILSDRTKKAVNQGKYGSRAANDIMMNEYKNIMSNPLLSQHAKKFNAVMGGGSGASRKGWFGKTAEETAKEKALTARYTAENELQMQVETLVTANPRLSPEDARKLLIQDKSNKLDLSALETRAKMGKLGFTDSARKWSYNAKAPATKHTKDFEEILKVPGGATPDQIEVYQEGLRIDKARQMQAIDASGMLEPAKEQARTRLNAQYTMWGDLSGQTSTEILTARKENIDANIDTKASEVTAHWISTSPLFAKSYFYSKSTGMDMVDVMNLITNKDSMYGQLMLSNEAGQNLLEFFGGDIDTAGITYGETIDSLLGDNTAALVGAHKKTLGVTASVPATHRAVIEQYEKAPAKAVGNIENSPIALDRVASTKEFKAQAENPEYTSLTQAYIRAGGKNSRLIQEAKYSDQPLTTLSAGKTGGKGGNRKWIIKSGGVPLTKEFQASYITAIKTAQANSHLWEVEFTSAQDYVNSSFLYNGPKADRETALMARHDREAAEKERQISAKKWNEGRGRKGRAARMPEAVINERGAMFEPDTLERFKAYGDKERKAVAAFEAEHGIPWNSPEARKIAATMQDSYMTKLLNGSDKSAAAGRKRRAAANPQAYQADTPSILEKDEGGVLVSSIRRYGETPIPNIAEAEAITKMLGEAGVGPKSVIFTGDGEKLALGTKDLTESQVAALREGVIGIPGYEVEDLTLNSKDAVRQILAGDTVNGKTVDPVYADLQQAHELAQTEAQRVEIEKDVEELYMQRVGHFFSEPQFRLTPTGDVVDEVEERLYEEEDTMDDAELFYEDDARVAAANAIYDALPEAPKTEEVEPEPEPKVDWFADLEYEPEGGQHDMEGEPERGQPEVFKNTGPRPLRRGNVDDTPTTTPAPTPAPTPKKVQTRAEYAKAENEAVAKATGMSPEAAARLKAKMSQPLWKQLAEVFGIEFAAAPIKGQTYVGSKVSDLEAALSFEENRSGSGWDEKAKLWSPHPSAEKGPDSLGYGHKLDTDPKKNIITLGGVKVDLNKSITEDQAVALLRRDMTISRKAVSSKVPGYSALLPKYQDVLLLLHYNSGKVPTNKKGSWPSLFKAMVAKDDAGVRKEMETSFKKKGSNKIHYLTSRRDRLADALNILDKP